MRRLLDSPWLYFGLAALLAVAAVASQLEWVPRGKPAGTAEQIEALEDRDDLNLVLIVIDTLRADRLSAYGYERPTSPNLDRLASRGIRFANVESQSSWTKTSMASMWTGLYPQRNGILRFGDSLPEAAVLPAERLKEAGFFTAGIYRNEWVGPNFGFSQGFDLYLKSALDIAELTRQRREGGPSGGKPTDSDVTDLAVEFLRSRYEERFFLYAHYMDVHQYTYESQSELFGSDFSDLYDNAIHWADRNVERLRNALERLGVLDETIIVVISDHGEAFFEHGNEGHAKGLYREVQHTPWLISLPFDLPEPIVVETPVANVDVWPTLFDLLGLEPLPVADGISAVPAILAAARGEPVPESHRDRPLFAQIDRRWGKVDGQAEPSVSVVQAPYRMYKWLNDPSQDVLFDHRDDPDEQKNIVRKQPEVAERLSQRIDTYIDESDPAFEASTVELLEMRLNQLRALGYKID